MFNQLPSSEASSQSATTEESDIEQSLLIGCRTAYGRGMVSTIAHFDAEAQVVLLEERDREGSTFTLLATIDAIRRLAHFLIMAEKHLPLERGI